MAVPPVQTNTNTELGMQIFFPEFEVVKQGASFTLHVHTSNKSDGHFFNANQYDCFAHLYGPGGTHTFESGPMSDDSNGLEKELVIGAGNFSENGQHGYYIWCNISSVPIGGEARGLFEVTVTGTELETSSSIVYMGIEMLLVFLFVLTIVGILALPKDDSRDEEGVILQVSQMKHFFWPFVGVAWGLMIAILFTTSNIAKAYLGAAMMGDLLFMAFTICTWMSVILVPMMFIFLFQNIWKSQQVKKMLSQGAELGGNI